MLVDTMIPEAFEQTHALAGLITVIGFLTAFILSQYAERSEARHAARVQPAARATVR
jgi:hypothetical protein